MKVSEVIERLKTQYDLDQDIICVWYGSEFRETSAGVWEQVVNCFDDYAIPSVFDTYIIDLVKDFESLRREEGIDSYLHDLAEQELPL